MRDEAQPTPAITHQQEPETRPAAFAIEPQEIRIALTEELFATVVGYGSYIALLPINSARLCRLELW